MKNQQPLRINGPKEKALKLKATVCALLQWSDFDYANFQYECGLAYLGHYIAQDKWGQDMLQRTRLFWNWWKLQWANRDDAYLSCNGDVLEKVSLQNRRLIYQHLHDAGTLASEIYPGRVILDDTYDTMIQSLIKTEVHA